MTTGLTARLIANPVMSVPSVVNFVMNAAYAPIAPVGIFAKTIAVKTEIFAWIALWTRGVIVPIATNAIWKINYGAMNAADAAAASKTATIAVYIWARAAFVSSAH